MIWLRTWLPEWEMEARDLAGRLDLRYVRRFVPDFDDATA